MQVSADEARQLVTELANEARRYTRSLRPPDSWRQWDDADYLALTTFVVSRVCEALGVVITPSQPPTESGDVVRDPRLRDGFVEGVADWTEDHPER